ncbi:MAG: hypothetical protein HYZ27_06445, partial [Deltaproteobacteria bacterium]|nr:hypothetical protein [Deltaproteobacteria bacterium]
DGACTPERNAKNALVIANAVPTIAAVSIPDADGQAERDEVLSCDWSGWDDPDGDPATVTYAWFVTPTGASAAAPIAGATASTLTIDSSLAAGDAVGCRVTPINGDAAGVARESDNRILIVAPAPVAPTVAVEAPAGAEGTATCVLEHAGKWIPAGARWTWYWSRNGEAETVGAQTLDADAITSCDLLRCRAAITDAGVDLSSNIASLQMALGADCDDGNPCTTGVCFAGGGCNMVPVDGRACDDGDPCTDQEWCAGGSCVGSVDLCTEDRLSVTATSIVRPALAATPAGGWVAQWLGPASSQQWLRATDGDESRLGTELNVAAGSGSAFWNEPVVASDGSMAVLRVEEGPAQLYVSCGGCTAQSAVGIHLQRYSSTLGAPGGIDDQVVSHLYWSATATYPYWGVRQAGIGPAKVQLVALGDGRLGVLRAYENGAARSGLVMTPIGADQAVGADITLVGPAAMGSHELWDVASVPDGSNRILAVWVGPDGKSVFVDRFSATGVEEFNAPLAVATLADAVNAVRVVAMANGRFVVLWEGAGVDGSGLGIAGQRFDDQGSLLG